MHKASWQLADCLRLPKLTIIAALQCLFSAQTLDPLQYLNQRYGSTRAQEGRQRAECAP